jgi:hypothetical protein
MTITLEPPNGELFLGGWVGNDGWGTMCGDNGASHEPEASPAYTYASEYAKEVGHRNAVVAGRKAWADRDQSLDGYYADTPLGLIG